MKLGVKTWLVAGTALASVANAQPGIEVVFSSVPSAPTSVIPGAGGRRFYTGTTPSMQGLRRSPDGQRWVMFIRADDFKTGMLAGRGLEASLSAFETDAVPGLNATVGYIDTPCAISNSGVVAFSTWMLGPPSATNQAILKHEPGSGLSIVVREGEAAAGLIDAPGQVSGDETFGGALSSPAITESGVVGFLARGILQLANGRRTALYLGGSPLLQQRTPLFGVAYDEPVAATLRVTADGSRWMAEVDADPDAANVVDALVIDGQVVLAEGDAFVPGGPVVSIISDNNLLADGRWIAFGGYSAGGAWAAINGTVMFQSGDVLQTALGPEQIGSGIAAFHATSDGRTLLACETTNPNPARNLVLVLDGGVELAREGDRLDVDRNGVLDDDAFIHAFGGMSTFIGSDGFVYFLCNVANGSGVPLNSALLRVAIEGDCEPDLTTTAIPGQAGYGVPNGTLNNDDFFYYLLEFSAGNLAKCDLTTAAIPGTPGYGAPNGVLNNDDFFYYLNLFAAGC